MGWYYGNFLWRIRGFLDLLVGGVGLRRGRRDPETPLPGDAVDVMPGQGARSLPARVGGLGQALHGGLADGLPGCR